MVKIPKGPVVPMEPRDPHVEPPAQLCPALDASFDGRPVEVAVGSRADAQLRDGRIRVLANGQLLGWMEAVAPQVVSCMERGTRYSGSVTRVGPSFVTVHLEPD